LGSFFLTKGTMKKETIKFIGKDITLAYCYATEIAYKDLADEDISVYIQEIFTSSQKGEMPDVKKAVYLILAAMMAYYNSTGEECPVKDTDIINEATPEEFGAAIASVINLWKAFYKVPTSEQKPAKKTGKKEKN
jgi:hypothetical protein